MRKQIIHIVSLCYVLLASICFSQKNVVSPYQFPKQIGTLHSKKLSEISGIAASYKHENILWMINDSGNGPYLYAVKHSGEIASIYYLSNIRNIDWEDLSSFSINQQSYLIIADIGDNDGVRPNRRLYFIEEPELVRDPQKKNELKVNWQVEYTYEDGPRDCESMAVDLKHERILLLSKRDKPPRMYTIPLLPLGQERKVVAEKIGVLTAIPPISNRDIRFNQHLQWGNQPTAMDISSITHDLVIQTYKTAYLYPGDSDSDASWNFQQCPVPLVLPLLKQAESLCFDQDGQALYVTTEKLPAPVIQLKKKE